MNKIFQKLDATNLVLFLMICFPLFKIHWNSYTIVALLLIGIYKNFKKPDFLNLKVRVKKNSRVFFNSTLLFYFFLATILYSQNPELGIGSLTRLLPLLLLPVIFFFLLKPINKVALSKILYIFLVACVMSTLYINYNLYNLGLFTQMDKISFFNMPFREAVMSFKYEPLHPTYISLWYCFSICIIVHFFKRTTKLYLKLLFVLFSLLLLITIIILSSRIAFLILLVLVLFFIITKVPKKTRKYFTIAFILISFYGVTQVSFISSRVIDEFKQTKLAPPVGKAHNSLNIRVGIYTCSVKLVKDNFFLGLGIGDVQMELNNCYLNYNTDAYLITNYNSHSYFLHVLLVGGILGFFSFIYMFYFFVKVAIKHKGFLYGGFLIIILLSMLFENVLSRNHGIVFFAIFNSIFISYHFLNHQNVNSNNSIISQ